MITNSLEWANVEDELIRKSKNLSNSKDIKKLIANIRITVTELSKAEVNARRGKSSEVIRLLEQVNRDIEMVHEYLLIASIIG